MISVIIPVYNSKPYLNKCLDSVLGQTYTDMQVIIVDDGSSDGSGAVCDEYAQKDSRVEAYHIPNSGTVISRRTGLSKAKGQYVCFVDSDDWIEPDMITNLIEQFDDESLDFVVFGAIHNENGDVHSYIPENNSICIKNAEDRKSIISNYLLSPKHEYRIPMSLWSKIYRREFITRCFEKMPDNIWYGEDYLCMFYSLLFCNGFKTVDKAYYHYMVRKNTVSHRKHNDYIEVESRLSAYLLNIFDEFHEVIDNTIFWKVIKRRAFYLLNYECEGQLFLPNYYFPEPELLRRKKVLIYGAGNVGTDYYESMARNKDIELVGIVDKKAGDISFIWGIVHTPDYIKYIEYDYVVLAINSKEVACEIFKELEGLGIKKERIIWREPISL
ncbi:glycosyltransferase [Butyrivibrio proteoclasticus]|uniref:glycosyltransferase n=1 Tax=Butyrivibrio proteoclasticus TaxID=43305 RepID=UPI000478726F|nr:glycosyltransferase [Butyrivibrio proteoclasticus]